MTTFLIFLIVFVIGIGGFVFWFVFPPKWKLVIVNALVGIPTMLGFLAEQLEYIPWYMFVPEQYSIYVSLALFGINTLIAMFRPQTYLENPT